MTNHADTRATLRSQYGAALAMLRQAVVDCPERLWLGGDRACPFWQVAYHALFYTHLYLQDSEADFQPWPRQRGEAQYLGERPWLPGEPPELGEPYSRDEILQYLELCRAEAAVRCSTVDLGAPSGFEWLPFGKLELQIYNIRHIQQHASELMSRLQDDAGIEGVWVGTARDQDRASPTKPPA